MSTDEVETLIGPPPMGSFETADFSLPPSLFGAIEHVFPYAVKSVGRRWPLSFDVPGH